MMVTFLKKKKKHKNEKNFACLIFTFVIIIIIQKGDATLGNDLTVGENDNGIDYFINFN